MDVITHPKGFSININIHIMFNDKPTDRTPIWYNAYIRSRPDRSENEVVGIDLDRIEMNS